MTLWCELARNSIWQYFDRSLSQWAFQQK